MAYQTKQAGGWITELRPVRASRRVYRKMTGSTILRPFLFYPAGAHAGQRTTVK